MKHTRIVAAFLIALSTLTALVGCNSDPKDLVTTPQTMEETTVADDTTADTTTVDVEEATEADEPGETEAVTDPATPETQAPVVDERAEMEAQLEELLSKDNLTYNHL